MSRRKSKDPRAGLAQPRGAEPRTALIQIRCEPEVKARIAAAARAARMTMSAWLLAVADSAIVKAPKT